MTVNEAIIKKRWVMNWPCHEAIPDEVRKLLDKATEEAHNNAAIYLYWADDNPHPDVVKWFKDQGIGETDDVLVDFSY